MRRLLLTLVLMLLSLLAATSAQAVVVDMGAAGHFGVALVPGTDRAANGIQTVTSTPPCSDPWLATDLGGPVLPNSALCWHGGAVIHSNESFDLAWDPLRRDWATTRHFLEQFMQNVANGSGTRTAPYALTTQYQDHGGRAGNASLYGGGCIDYGVTGGASCDFSSTSRPGNSYPASGCAVTGTNQFHLELSGAVDSVPNDICLTDAQIKAEVAAQVHQQGIVGHLHPGYTPLLVLMTPPGVITCLDGSNKLCSANSVIVPPLPFVETASSGGSVTAGDYKIAITYVTGSGETVASAPRTVSTTGSTSEITVGSPPPVSGATGWYLYVAQAGSTLYTRQPGGPVAIGASQTLTTPPTSNGPSPPTTPPLPTFCSYHSQVNVDGTNVPYVVQPWVALAWLTGCDEPDSPVIPENPDPTTLANDVGARLVSPLSQGELAAITDPGLDAWSGQDGSEINDNGYPNGCVPFNHGLDTVTVAGTSYLLQREFNNGGVIVSDPNALACEGNVVLAPAFVTPSAVNPGDVVEFDGSKTVSTLVVPRAGYVWNFGDGTGAVGPSVEHRYAKDGNYTVTLTVTDRGGNVASYGQPMLVLGSNGQPVTTPAGFHAALQLMPQNLRSVLRHGVTTRVSSNQAANGIVTLSISRSAARKAHLRTGRSASVVLGRGTVSGIKVGAVTLHVRVPRALASRLARLRHVTLTVTLALTTASHAHLTLDAAGRY